VALSASICDSTARSAASPEIGWSHLKGIRKVRKVEAIAIVLDRMTTNTTYNRERAEIGVKNSKVRKILDPMKTLMQECAIKRKRL